VLTHLYRAAQLRPGGNPPPGAGGPGLSNFETKPHALFSARKGKLNVTVYQKGPKVLIQGKDTEDFIRFTLEPEVLGEARLGYEEILSRTNSPPTSASMKAARAIFSGRWSSPGCSPTPPSPAA
jgi:hypothetical protein